ncbi:MAG: hypothetical protein HY951_01135 [Bacteroidia bacterium]|nr:hypothetical protein [Bacteroidia bacterium]
MAKFKILIVFTFIMLASIYSNAIPAFSRKYKTSCVTCHTIYPQLNSFGEAFRINGYQFPNDDEENTKEETVPMGAEAYKRVWPKAVWPNFMPGSAPFALRGRTGFQITTVDSSMTSEFGRPAIQLLGAGTVGKDISLFVGAHLFENGATGSVDRLYVKFDNLLTKFLPEKFLYLQIGQFIPELVPFATNHRGLTESAYAFNTYDPSMGSSFVAGHEHSAGGGHGSGPFGLEQFQLGVEASGVVHKRLRYVLGVVNGSSTNEDVNSDRDFYGRLAYKIGGIAYDGSFKDSIKNGMESSFALGVFGYKGIGTDTSEMNFNFYRIGGDLNFNFRKLNLVGGYIMGESFNDMNEKYNLFFGEINYSFYPWIMAVLRYEQANPGMSKTARQVVPHLSMLIVPNVKFKIETRLNPDKLGFENLFLGFDFAF